MSYLKRFLDFVLGCFVAPGFIFSLFLTYLKLASFAASKLGVVFVNLLQQPIQLFAEFVDRLYAWTFEWVIEASITLVSNFTHLFGLTFTFTFPEWYSTAAYFSTILYGAQTTSMKLYQPVIGNTEVAAESGGTEISAWPKALLGTLWNAILLIYIPVNSLANQLRDFLGLENLSGKKVSRIFKIVTLGFLMIGYLFLIHDLFWMLFNRRNKTAEATQHRNFHFAIFLAFVTSVAFTWFSIQFASMPA